MFLAAPETLTFSEQITPFLPILCTVFGALVVGVFAVWNRKRGAIETKSPSVSEIWAREERISKQNRWLFAYADRLKVAFRAYVERVQDGGSKDLTPFEQKALDTDPADEPK